MLIIMFVIILVFLIGVFLYGKRKYGFYERGPKSLESFLYPAAMVMIKIFPKKFFGSEDLLKDKYLELYGEKDYLHNLKMDKIRIAAYFYLVVLVFCIFLAVASFKEQFEDKEIFKIQRPLWEEGDTLCDVQAVMSYEDEEYIQTRSITVKRKLLTQEEVNQALEKTKKQIDLEILADNTDLDHVYKPLKLYTKDPNTYATIKWTSEMPSLVDERGNVYSHEIEGAERLVLWAEIKLQNQLETYPVELTIVPFESQASSEEIINWRLDETIETLNNENEEDYVVLPKTFEDVSIKWLTDTIQYVKPIMMILIFTLIMLFSGRYSKVNKRIKQKRIEIEKDFPDFISKLVLLMNTGLIVQSALEKIAYDYDKYSQGKNKKPLYDELFKAMRNVGESGTSLELELKTFANRCHVKEIMRFVSIVSENIHMGSTLTEKLQLEADQAWHNRKSKAEEIGRLAETKLTFPLVILLVVLITIIITPALMEM